MKTALVLILSPLIFLLLLVRIASFFPAATAAIAAEWFGWHDVANRLDDWAEWAING